MSACDARLTAFYGLGDATRCWIKGRQFSLAGLLADNSQSQTLASQFDDGCMMIFRLAPQVNDPQKLLMGSAEVCVDKGWERGVQRGGFDSSRERLASQLAAGCMIIFRMSPWL